MTIAHHLVVRVHRVLQVLFKVLESEPKVVGMNHVLPLCGEVPLSRRLVSEHFPKARTHPLVLGVLQIPVPDSV